MAFEWSDKLSVNVKEIDAQHKHFIEILNEVYDYVINKEVENVIKIGLVKLTDYAKVHFATEEKYFDMFNYEHAVEHKEAHRKLVAAINDFIKEKENTTDIYMLTIDLIDLLEDWLVNHLGTMDKRYTKCFNEHGLY
jgi:hemerythrin-like metal-binding protein